MSEVVARRSRHDPRRERTRAALLQAARRVFERDGFYPARLADITDAAGVSTGTLYNYYRSKEEIFRDVITDVARELSDVAEYADVDRPREPVEGLRAANRAYVHGYRRNARLMLLLPQIGDEDIRALLSTIIENYQDRLIKAIKRWQRDGLVYTDIDATYTAHALTFMTQRLAIAASEGPAGFEYDEELLVATINQVWERALGFERNDG
ncbi:TetR/AcrR family transcriptional regulator [Aldersonia kunmingensis]|uniref:TetR/AcrR family transcriptional regulator n=1 Tax=Aldersonia kunmingensis TaxID=408066 RepID=UPI0008318421|nr:TetR/AcrR family transcriptional regulator [Aldersonia kunmingensis]